MKYVYLQLGKQKNLSTKTIIRKLLMKKTILTVLFGLATVFMMQAQQTVVKGQVIDADSTDPLSGVSVSIKGTNLKQTTEALGVFNFTKGLPLGEQTLLVYKKGYVPKDFTILIEEGKIVDISTLILNEDLNEGEDFSITLSEDELDSDENLSSNTSGILQSSRDVFARTAAFEFSATFFRVRGLDSETGTLLLNGIRMNKIFNGRPQWSNWGGINDVMRNQDFVLGSKANDYAFGNIGGTTNVNLRASQYRKGSRISYASSNRSYTNRAMVTHSSGLKENGWAYTFTFGRRWGDEGFNEGTFYDANSLFTSIEKKINDKHSINLTSIYTPNRRGRSVGMTQEVFDLKGNKYNSYWGYHDGEKRNSRVREISEPILMLNHYWKISEKTTLNTNVSSQFGSIGNSRIDFNGNNPDPTYYQNLPSYGLRLDRSDSSLANAYTLRENFINDGQVDWNAIYDANLSNPDNAVYVLYEDRNDDKQWTFNSILNTELTENISLDATVNYTTLRSHNYAKVLDLLGATSYLDIDYFDNIDNNALTPGRTVTEGDTFRYNFNLDATTYDAFVQGQFKYNKVDFYVGGQYGNTTYQREGLYQSPVFVNNSLGKGEKLDFTKLGAKAGLTYKISGKHLIDLNAAYIQDAPTVRNSFLNSRQNNLVVPDLTEVKTTSADASYIFRSGIFKSRLTAFYSRVEDATKVAFFYIDGIAGLNQTRDFVQEATTGINRQNIGLELGAEAQVTPTIKLKGALALGQFIYTNNPNVYLANNTDEGITSFGEATLENYRIAGGPQQAASIGFEYRDPKYWWISATANFFSNAYIDVASITRTGNFSVNPDDGLPITNYDENIARELLKQEVIDDYMLVNLVGGKSWKIDDKFISVFASVSNLLGEVYKTGGYEQSRNGNYTQFLEDSNRPGGRLFGPRYWFGRSATYFLNVSLRF